MTGPGAAAASMVSSAESANAKALAERMDLFESEFALDMFDGPASATPVPELGLSVLAAAVAVLARESADGVRSCP